MRTGLVGVGTKVNGDRRAAWCVLYPRVIANFPVPSNLVEYHDELVSIADSLRRLASLIVNRWRNVDCAIDETSKKPLALFDEIDFSHWQGDTPEGAEMRLIQENGKWILQPFVESQSTFMHIEGPRELLNVVKYLIEKRGNVITAHEFQELQVPEDPNPASGLIDNAWNPKSLEITQFIDLQLKADRIIAREFGLTEDEFSYLLRRLSTPPLDVLQPRFPWIVAEKRGIQTYERDRFT